MSRSPLPSLTLLVAMSLSSGALAQPATDRTGSAPAVGADAREDVDAAVETRANLDASALKSDGRASFPGLDGVDDLEVAAHLSVIAQYAFALRREADASDWFHEFELPRAMAWVDARHRDAEARVLVEAVRSASEGALVGVAGDSLLLRLREAWASYTAWGLLEARAGLVPTLSVQPIEGLWGMRPVHPTGLERTGLGSPADLGATLRAVLPRRHGWVGVGGYNGEGYARRELNRGKNVEIAAHLHPFASLDGGAPFTVFASYVSGSTGTGLGRADRLNAGLGYRGDWLRGGATATYALGSSQDPEADAQLLEAFVRVMPIERLVLGANLLHWHRDLEVEGDTALTLTGAAGWYFTEGVAAFVAADGQLFGEPAREALPGRDDLRLRVIAAASF